MRRQQTGEEHTRDAQLDAFEAHIPQRSHNGAHGNRHGARAEGHYALPAGGWLLVCISIVIFRFLFASSDSFRTLLHPLLQIPSCYLFKQTFNRPNLRYTVHAKPKDCIKQIAAEIRRAPMCPLF
jgi:hypothetical protein